MQVCQKVVGMLVWLVEVSLFTMNAVVIVVTILLGLFCNKNVSHRTLFAHFIHVSVNKHWLAVFLTDESLLLKSAGQ